MSGPPPPVTDATEELGQAFRATMAAVRRLRGRETHHPGELSFAQYSLLFRLAEHEPMSARELAEAADLSAATTTQMLDSLAAAGLVRRTRATDDKRIVRTSLTHHGRAVVARRHAEIEPRWRTALAEFSAEELRAATRVLERLHAMFDGFDAPR